MSCDGPWPEDRVDLLDGWISEWRAILMARLAWLNCVKPPGPRLEIGSPPLGTAGFDPLIACDVADAGRLEAPGSDLHQFGLHGEFVDLDQPRAAVGAAELLE